MHRFSILISFFLGLFAVNLANADDSSCLAKMPGGKFAGECLDLKDYRTASRIPEDKRLELSRQLGDPDIADPRFEVIEGFAYQKKFWKAVIPVFRIQDTVYQQVIILPKI